ncbi:MAG: sporulation integral membrane protein YtvI [Peptococcaceae bacterium]|jgi:sporulation integral membrane protein YtvI|nr:sporulation integral membrane protein YtvI [Peptococcaceae bacterium]MDH7524073.1 sporulation integral membrane protein YtvI [Peptococcaceae bacterium]
MNTKIERHLENLLKIGTALVLIVAVFFTFNYLFPLLFNVSESLVWGFLPFILAVVLAILIDPLVDWLSTKKRIKRGLAVAIALIMLFAGIVLLVVLAVSRLVVELAGLYASLPGYTQQLLKSGLEIINQLKNYISNNPLPPEAQAVLSSNMQNVVNGLTGFIGTAVSFLFGLIAGLPGFVTVIIVSGLATFFISRDKALIMRFLYSLIPKRFIRPTSMVIGEASGALVGFFRAQTILISLTGFLTVIGLYIIKIDYALTLGIIVGIFDLLPVLGPGTILVPWAVIQLLAGNFSFGVSLFVLYAVLVGVRQLLEPRIVSRQIGLHPLATLMALYVGLAFIGVWGIVIGPFSVVLVKAVVKSVKNMKKEQ